MTEIQNFKPAYDLEERTFQFAKNVRLFVKTLPSLMQEANELKKIFPSILEKSK
jgi:hypothetical protein